MRPSITLQRHKEHDEIADSFDGRAFSRSEFKQRYQAAYPTRAPGSMIPFKNFCGSPARMVSDALESPLTVACKLTLPFVH